MARLIVIGDPFDYNVLQGEIALVVPAGNNLIITLENLFKHVDDHFVATNRRKQIMKITINQLHYCDHICLCFYEIKKMI